MRPAGALLPKPVVMARNADGRVRQSMWVHRQCAIHSAEVKVDFHGRLCYVSNAIKRGRQLKCTACKGKGATVGCVVESCQRNYHYTCVPLKNTKLADGHAAFLCHVHAKANSLPLSFTAQQTASAVELALSTTIAAARATATAATTPPAGPSAPSPPSTPSKGPK